MEYKFLYRESHSGTVVPHQRVADMAESVVVNGGMTAMNIASSWLPEGTNPRMWAALLGLTGAAVCFAGYKVWVWVDNVRRKKQDAEKERSSRYEYKYLGELDALLQATLDDVENPDMANVDKIKVGGNVFPLSVFKGFSRNLRKRMVRNADEVPVVTRVSIPADVFDWVGSYAEDMVPVGSSRDPAEGKKVVMRYDPETEAFWWYCDNPSVQYKYLEAVARKYACDFNRADVFVDIRDELKRGEEESTRRQEGGADAVAHENDTNQKKVYAKFKKYNKKAARVDPTLGGKRVVLKAKSNRYSYKGKMADYEKMVNTRDEVVVDDSDVGSCDSGKRKRQTETVSWSQWKIGNFEGWR